jgi:hypothetical protein
LHFNVGARLCGIYGTYDTPYVPLENQLCGITENHNRNGALREILLIADVLVSGKKCLKRSFLLRLQLIAVGPSVPTKIFRLFDRMADEE